MCHVHVESYSTFSEWSVFLGYYWYTSHQHGYENSPGWFNDSNQSEINQLRCVPEDLNIQTAMVWAAQGGAMFITHPVL